MYLYTMSLFPFFYFLRVSGAVDSDTSALTFSICNVVAKMLFLSVSMAPHIDVISTITKEQQRFSRLVRNLFLRYIMHEIRGPLNSISLGVEFLQSEFSAEPNRSNAENSDERVALLGGSFPVQESLGLIIGASSTISKTLDDILENQRIEEGLFEISYIKFSFLKFRFLASALFLFRACSRSFFRASEQVFYHRELFLPSSTMPAKSVPSTSALTSPSTISQMAS